MRRSRSSNSPGGGRLGVRLCALLWLAAPGPADASPAPAEVRDSFGDRYREAETLYEAGRYADSIRALRAAYAVRPLPRLLLNIGQLHLKLAQPQQALDAYEQYLLAEPRMTEDDRSTVEGGMARARRMMQEDERQRVAQAAAQRALLQRQEQRREPPARPPLHRRWWLWTGVGVVLAGTATGLALGLTRPWQPQDPEGVPILPFDFPMRAR